MNNGETIKSLRKRILEAKKKNDFEQLRVCMDRLYELIRDVDKKKPIEILIDSDEGDNVRKHLSDLFMAYFQSEMANEKSDRAEKTILMQRLLFD